MNDEEYTVSFVLRLFLAVAAVGTASMLPAAPVLAQEETLGVIDFQRALTEVSDGVAAKATLKQEFETKQKTLDEKQAELKRLKDELDSRGMMMKAEAKQEKINELQKKAGEAQQLYVTMQQDLSKREMELTNTIFTRMREIVQTLGTEKGYTLIVERSAVLYAKGGTDLTEELIRRYNSTYSKGKKLDGDAGKKDTKKDGKKGGK